MSAEKELDVHLQLPIPVEDSPGRHIRKELDRLAALLVKLEECVVPECRDRILDMQEQIKNFEVRVSLVGQVKAGKTSLANSLIGRPDMLPSNVNPWTSVVTSVHINAPRVDKNRAVFTFFTQEEWDSMVNLGGRLGEMAQRANFDDELVEVQAQIDALQSAAKRRLGRNFKYLLGNSHSFSGFHPEMIKRYVCLGEDGDEDARDGRFADLTKSADLYMDDPYYPLPIVFRDTPGVNDPFLVREAVTLDHLSESDICVIVLSAHQAFTTVDIALIRILMTLRHDQIVLFINRIDELHDPDQQIAEIDANIRETLVNQGLPKDLPIVFGSAQWANATSFGVTDGLLDDSATTLENLIDARTKKSEGNRRFGRGVDTSVNKTHDLSGLGELQQLIENKSAKSVGGPLLDKLREQTLDVCRQSGVLMQQALRNKAPVRSDLDVNALIDQMDTMLSNIDKDCTRVTKECSEQMLYDMSAAYRSFIFRETKSLNSALDTAGTPVGWSPDTDKLRRELNAAYQDFSEAGQAAMQEIFLEAAEKVSGLYASILDDNNQLFVVKPLIAKEARTPTSLMRSMDIDVSKGWLGTLITRKINKSAFVKRMSHIAEEEMRMTIDEMQNIYIVDFIKTARVQLHGFLSSHIQTLQNLSALDGNKQRTVMRRKLGVDAEINSRLLEISEVEAELIATHPDMPKEQTAA